MVRGVFKFTGFKTTGKYICQKIKLKIDILTHAFNTIPSEVFIITPTSQAEGIYSFPYPGSVFLKIYPTGRKERVNYGWVLAHGVEYIFELIFSVVNHLVVKHGELIATGNILGKYYEQLKGLGRALSR